MPWVEAPFLAEGEKIMIDVASQNERLMRDPDPRCDALRSEMEGTRTVFHALLDSFTDPDWRGKSASCAWTVGEVFVHLTWALEYLPKGAEKARQMQCMFNLPKHVSDWLSFWYMRWIARTATLAMIRRCYNDAMDASIRVLVSIEPDDW